MDKLINNALRQQFATITQYSLAYENVSFTPTLGTAYLKEAFLPAETIPVGLEDTSHDNYTGIYQINVYSPKGQGVAQIDTAINVIRDKFKRGTVLNNLVRIEKFYRHSHIIEDSWVVTPVRIVYRAFIKNN